DRRKNLCRARGEQAGLRDDGLRRPAAHDDGRRNTIAVRRQARGARAETGLPQAQLVQARQEGGPAAAETGDSDHLLLVLQQKTWGSAGRLDPVPEAFWWGRLRLSRRLVERI